MLLTEFWASFWPNWAVFGLKTLKQDFSPKNYSVQLLRFYVALTSWKKSKTFQALIFQNKIFKFFQNKIFDFFFPKTKFWARLGSLSPQNPRTISEMLRTYGVLRIPTSRSRENSQQTDKKTKSIIKDLHFVNPKKGKSFRVK